MQYTSLGRTGLQVSRLCLGTMNFGPIADEPTSHAVLDAARAAGVTFVDTANVYGSWDGSAPGRTEEILGTWFAQGGGRREDIVLATKVFQTMRGDEPGARGLSARQIRRECEDSLRRLQTDYIDLYQMHHVDRRTPWEEIWQAMDQLVAQGKVLYVGSSNFAGWHLAAANEAAYQRNSLGLVAEQSLYHLLARTVELEVLPACEHYGIGVIPWSPLAGGLLGGALAGEGRRRQSANVQDRLATCRPQIEAYEKLCAELGQPPADVALAWLLTRPAVTAPIIGPRSVEQLQDTLGVPDLALEAETLRRLDEIFPGPGGPAPEAYAW